MRHRRTGYLLLLVLLAQPAFAQERTHDVTPDDYFTLNTITEIAVSPDGKHVAYCLATWDKVEDNRKTDLWVVATDGKGKPARLTFDRANDRKPKWSADGKSIYVLGNRKREAEKKPPFDGATQVWRIDVAGGDPKAVTREAGGVSDYDYAGQAEVIYFSKDVDHIDEDEFSKLRTKYCKVEYGHGKRKVSEIHKLDVNTWRSEKLIDEKRYVREFAVTRDGKRIVMVSAFDDSVVKSEGESRVDVWEAGKPGASATGGKVVTPPTDVYRAKAASPWAWLESLAWSPDGKRFAFCAIFDAYPTEIIIGELKDGKWTTKRMERVDGLHLHGYGSPLKWGWPTNERTGHPLFYLGEQQGLSEPFACYPEAEGITPLIRKFHHVCYVFDHHPGWFAGLQVTGTPESFAALKRFEGKTWTTLVDPNLHTKTWKLPTVQHLSGCKKTTPQFL
jgi:hypothetical protein